MPNHRDRGHLFLHKGFVLLTCFAWFWVSVWIWERWEFSLIILPWNYALVALAGLLVASFGAFQDYGVFYIKNGWQRIRDSIVKSNFQTAVIAFFVFGAYFATKDKETSRLFLLFFVFGTWPVLIFSNFGINFNYFFFFNFWIYIYSSIYNKVCSIFFYKPFYTIYC